jgi:alanine-glyoxylate transaminase / serine-glyoxylate transaminase / serine-pyruvate transaminase
VSSFAAFVPPARVLMGPGPSQVPASVLSALGSPTIGHLDPAFLTLLDQISLMLRQLLGTSNQLTMPMSGTGSLGMETCIVNLVEPGDRVLVGVHGVFGQRLAEVARRAGAAVTVAESPWGRALESDLVRKAAAGHKFKLLCVVHAETSTGALTPLAPFRALADELGALLLVDAVTSLGGLPIDMDAVGVDVLYAGTQKCLSCPPGLSPISLNPRARAQLGSRSTHVQSWYADLGLISRYWGGERLYHHTAPINMLYALHEALRLALAEGLPARYQRHRRLSVALCAGLSAMGLRLPVPEAERLPPLTLVEVPSGIDEALVRRTLLTRYQLEVGAGLGPFKGQAFRIGLMGDSCSERNVLLCLSALEQALAEQGFHSKQPPVPAAAAHF